MLLKPEKWLWCTEIFASCLVEIVMQKKKKNKKISVKRRDIYLCFFFIYVSSPVEKITDVYHFIKD